MTDPNPALAEFLRERARGMRERADKLDADADNISGADGARARIVALAEFFEGDDGGISPPISEADNAIIAKALRLLNDQETERAPAGSALEAAQSVIGDWSRLYDSTGWIESELACMRELIAAALTAATQSADLGPQWLAWAVSMFGEIARDPKERALRFLEEAVELGQAAGISKLELGKILARVYSRPAGNIAKEIAQSRACLDLLAHIVGVDPAAASAAELDRVRSIPKQEWTRRHQAKVEAGFARAAEIPP